jgi:hypothetical protein
MDDDDFFNGVDWCDDCTSLGLIPSPPWADHCHTAAGMHSSGRPSRATQGRTSIQQASTGRSDTRCQRQHCPCTVSDQAEGDGCAAGGPFAAPGHASCGRDGVPQLAMASAQLSSSPLISQLIRQQQYQRPLPKSGTEPDARVNDYVHASCAQSAPVTGPVDYGRDSSDATSRQHCSQAQRSSASQGLGSCAGTQLQRQQLTGQRPVASASAQQSRMPPWQVCPCPSPSSCAALSLQGMHMGHTANCDHLLPEYVHIMA